MVILLTKMAKSFEIINLQGGPERLTHRKTPTKIIPEGERKNASTKLFRLNFKMVAFCFDDESEMGFH